jgi:hypothetical protein
LRRKQQRSPSLQPRHRQSQALSWSKPERRKRRIDHIGSRLQLTIVFGLLSPVLAVVALLTSRDSLLTSQKSLTVSQTSLEIAQRAYLTYGVVDEIPSGIKVHISNFGHVPATITGGTARYVRNLFPANVSLADISRKFSESPNKSVMSPGDTDAAFLFDLPKLSPEDDAAVKTGHQIGLRVI